ncbi:MAG: hypothetical protein K9W43_11385 [Candidatus Thorarchaeota archaeon]|nr:hypothetical protein [Candidatus Thorarchaeota archaeon]
MEKSRFIVPLVFCVVGILVTYYLTMLLTDIIHGVLLSYDPMPLLPGAASNDAVLLLRIIIPLTLIIFLVFSIPVTFAYLIGNKFVKIGAYHLGIIETGKRFTTKKILYRAASPALFALTFGQTILNLIPDFIIHEPASIPQPILPLFAPFYTILGSLVVLNVALFLYTPTWLLNDSGIVYNLKPSELEIRRCPDTMGVGRWVSNFLGGFSLLGYPISAFFMHFYRPFVILGIDMTNLSVFTSIFWTVGLPLLMMAFVMPAILLNEILLSRLSPIVHKLARSLGAKDVQLEILVDS